MVQAYGQAAGAAQSWARIQLVRGQSNGAVWQVDHTVPQARLAVGSDPSAGWPIAAFGVQPIHFELYWDGLTLFVADTQRAGGTTVNGAPLGPDWMQLRGRSEIVFGQAAFQLETSADQATPLMKDPSVAKRISLTETTGTGEINAESTRIAEPMFDPPSLAGERTMIADELSMPAMQQIGGLPMAPQRPSQRPPPPPMARPRLGGSPGGREVVRTVPDGQPAAPAEATRMLSLDDMPQQPGGPAAPPPSFGSGGAQPMNAPAFGQGPGAQPGYGGVTVSPPAPSMAAPGTGGFAPPPSFDQAANAKITSAPKVPPRTIALAAVAIIAVVVVGVMNMGGEEEVAPMPVPVAAAPPAMPPMPGAPTAGAAPMPGALGVPPAPGVPVPPPGTGPVGALPPGVAPPPGVPAAPLPPGTASGAGIAPLPVPGAPAPVVIPPPTPGVPVVAPSVAPPPIVIPPPVVVAPPPVAPVVAPPPGTVVPSTPPAAVVDPATLGPTDERLAADLVIAGRYGEALPRYQALAAAHPERPEYGAMVGVLTERLREMSCIGGLTPDGRPCTTGGVP